MNLKNFSDENLELRLKKLVKTERKITHLVLQCISEIDQRKLYLKKAYPSLFEFLVQAYGYSPSAAMRRIDGARLMQQIPEVTEQLENGSVNLSQVALLQRADRELKREIGTTIPMEIKRSLLAKIENQTQIKTEQLIAQTLHINLPAKTKTIHHKDESVTLTVTFTKEQMQILEQTQAALSHAVPDKNLASLVTYLAKKELDHRKPKRYYEDATKMSEVGITNRTTINTIPLTAATVVKPHRQKPQRKPIPQAIKKHLLQVQPKCTFRDPHTGKICGSPHFLQVDHIQSVSRYGGNKLENLQILCGPHNRYKFRQELKDDGNLRPHFLIKDSINKESKSGN